MDINLIKKLVKIFNTSGITDLEIEEEGFKIKIANKVRITQGTFQPQSAIQPVTSISSSTSSEENKSEEKSADNYHEVRSPIVGTFYRAPAPDADSYVQIGDTVSVGTVLCIVEAMKLMNEIESDADGKIVKIVAENGKPVEYNQPLFLIEPN